LGGGVDGSILWLSFAQQKQKQKQQQQRKRFFNRSENLSFAALQRLGLIKVNPLK
jgi:hypothetical protein